MTFPWLAFLPASHGTPHGGDSSEREERAGRRQHRGGRATPLRVLPGGDRELIALIQASDALAMDLLFTTYYSELVSFAMSYVRTREMAEDVVQDTFVRVWERRAEWTVRGSVAQYLYGAVRNRALNALAHERVVERQADRVAREQLSTVPVATNTGATNIEAGELAAYVARVIDGLPPRCREVFVLSRYRRLAQREIAATLGITVNTVNVQLGRALRALDEALRARELGMLKTE